MSEVYRRRGERDKNLVGFVLDEVAYAVDIAHVREIIQPLPVIASPERPPAVLGVADHRREVVPVLDLRARFGLPPRTDPRRPKWVLVRHQGRTVGLVVDRVTEVFGTREEDRREVPDLVVAGEAARSIGAVYQRSGDRAGGLVFVLDIDRLLLPLEEMEPAPQRLAFSAGGEPR